MTQTVGSAATTRGRFHETVQCSPQVHSFFGAQETADAVARARSRDGMFFVARKCQACSGWRLLRLS